MTLMVASLASMINGGKNGRRCHSEMANVNLCLTQILGGGKIGGKEHLSASKTDKETQILP